MSAEHICTVCCRPAYSHPARGFYSDEPRWPHLCCEGCLCGCFETEADAPKEAEKEAEQNGE